MVGGGGLQGGGPGGTLLSGGAGRRPEGEGGDRGDPALSKLSRFVFKGM